MRLGKRIGRSERFRGALCAGTAAYIGLVRRTGRWQEIGGETPARFWAAGEPFILAFWHNRLLMVPPFWPREKRIHMLISQHRDGELIARAIAYFGMGSIRGSSRRGGAAALRGMVKALRAGDYAGVTPDGPRGPRMRASEGIINAARLSGAPILPIAYSATRRRVLGSWDRFVLPLPFSRGVFLWGEPFAVPRDADPAAVERLRGELEALLTRLSDEADRLCGQAPIPAADARA